MTQMTIISASKNFYLFFFSLGLLLLLQRKIFANDSGEKYKTRKNFVGFWHISLCIFQF